MADLQLIICMYAVARLVQVSADTAHRWVLIFTIPSALIIALMGVLTLVGAITPSGNGLQ